MGPKDLADVCKYMKGIVIPHTPDNFNVAEPFRHGLSDDDLKAGIDAFRKFLYKLYDKLAENNDKFDVKTGAKYAPGTGEDSVRKCFPIITDLAAILFSLGTHGRLETHPRNELVVSADDMLIPFPPRTEKYFSLAKLTNKRKMEVFDFLSDTGFYFEDANFSEEVDFSKIGTFYVRYDDDDFLIIGLKLLAEAQINVKAKYYQFSDVFMRGYFYSLAALEPKPQIHSIHELVGGQLPEVKEWVLNIDKFLRDSGCKVVGDSSFTYTSQKTKKPICKIYLSITGGVIRPSLYHLAGGQQTYELTDGMLEYMRGGRGCGICAEKDPDFVHCRHGGPYCVTYNDEYFERCRYQGFNFPLNDVEEREILKKLIESEMSYAKS